LVCKLDRLGRDLRCLVNLVGDLTISNVGMKALASEGASIDTTTANGRLIFATFAGLAEFERELIIERTKADLASTRERGQHGGRPFKMTRAKCRLAAAAMGKPETRVRDLCVQLGITRLTLYRLVGLKCELRADVENLLSRRKRKI
jgi:DNA invertase Pin-like site-specific DNA recombinase